MGKLEDLDHHTVLGGKLRGHGGRGIDPWPICEVGESGSSLMVKYSF